MTSIKLNPLDRDALVAIIDARELAMNSLELGYAHSCALDHDECSCPELPNPVLDGLYQVLVAAVTRTLGVDELPRVMRLLQQVESGSEVLRLLGH